MRTSSPFCGGSWTIPPAAEPLNQRFKTRHAVIPGFVLPWHRTRCPRFYSEISDRNKMMLVKRYIWSDEDILSLSMHGTPRVHHEQVSFRTSSVPEPWPSSMSGRGFFLTCPGTSLQRFRKSQQQGCQAKDCSKRRSVRLFDGDR